MEGWEDILIPRHSGTHGLAEVTAPSDSWQHTEGEVGTPGKVPWCMGLQGLPAWAEQPDAINYKHYNKLVHRRKYSVRGVGFAAVVYFCFAQLCTDESPNFISCKCIRQLGHAQHARG